MINSEVILKDGKTYKVDCIYSDYGGNRLQNYYHIVNIDDNGFAIRLVKDKPPTKISHTNQVHVRRLCKKSNAYTIQVFSILNLAVTLEVSIKR